MLGPLQLLVLQVELMPLVLRVEVVSVDDVLVGPGGRFKYLVSLIIVGLQKVLEVEVGELLLSLAVPRRGLKDWPEDGLVPD